MAEEHKPKEIKKEQKTHNLPEPFPDVETLLDWHAPGRPFKQHSKEYFINILFITIAIEIIVFLFGMYLLMMVILSLVFLAFVLAIVPPHTFYYKVTTEGIRVEDSFFLWEELYDFYFIKHNGVEVVKVGTKAYFPGELMLMLGEVTTQQIKGALLPFLPFREYVHPTFTQKAGDWLEKNFPLEKVSHKDLKAESSPQGDQLHRSGAKIPPIGQAGKATI